MVLCCNKLCSTSVYDCNNGSNVMDVMWNKHYSQTKLWILNCNHWASYLLTNFNFFYPVPQSNLRTTVPFSRLAIYFGYFLFRSNDNSDLIFQQFHYFSAQFYSILRHLYIFFTNFSIPCRQQSVFCPLVILSQPLARCKHFWIRGREIFTSAPVHSVMNRRKIFLHKFP